MTAYIISYNRLTCLQNLCRDLEARGCDPVIIDNNSNYPPLVSWLWNCSYQVFRVANSGSKSPWTNGIVTGENYIVTDHDLDISGVPLDMVDKLMEGLKNNNVIKSGLSLEIKDLPDNKYANSARDYEGRFWKTKAGEFYSAPIDTTLAVYSAERLSKIGPLPLNNKFFNAVRSPPPYTARHLPWYNTPENLTEEEKYYLNNISNDGYWNYKYLEINGNNHI